MNLKFEIFGKICNWKNQSKLFLYMHLCGVFVYDTHSDIDRETKSELIM